MEVTDMKDKLKKLPSGKVRIKKKICGSERVNMKHKGASSHVICIARTYLTADCPPSYGVLGCHH